MTSPDTHQLSESFLTCFNAKLLPEQSIPYLRRGILALVSESRDYNQNPGKHQELAMEAVLAGAKEWLSRGKPLADLRSKEIPSLHDALDFANPSALKAAAKALRAWPEFTFEALSLPKSAERLEKEQALGPLPSLAGLTGEARAVALCVASYLSNQNFHQTYMLPYELGSAASLLRKDPARFEAARVGFEAGARAGVALAGDRSRITAERFAETQRKLETLMAQFHGISAPKARPLARSIFPELYQEAKEIKSLSGFAQLASAALDMGEREPFELLCQAMVKRDPAALTLTYRLAPKRFASFRNSSSPVDRTLLVRALEEGRMDEARWLMSQGALDNLREPQSGQNPFTALRDKALGKQAKDAPVSALLDEVALSWAQALTRSGSDKQQAAEVVQSALEACSFTGKAKSAKHAGFEKLVLDQSLKLASWVSPDAASAAPVKRDAPRI